MPKYRDDLTAKRLRELLSYDPVTGIFRWILSKGRQPAGSIAGCKNEKGYYQICVDGVTYRSHRLAWLYVHGCWPEDQIDHRNRVRDQNIFSNLRAATGKQNHQNKAIPKNNTSGHIGVSWHKRD